MFPGVAESWLEIIQLPEIKNWIVQFCIHIIQFCRYFIFFYHRLKFVSEVIFTDWTATTRNYYFTSIATLNCRIVGLKSSSGNHTSNYNSKVRAISILDYCFDIDKMNLSDALVIRRDLSKQHIWRSSRYNRQMKIDLQFIFISWFSIHDYTNYYFILNFESLFCYFEATY